MTKEDKIQIALGTKFQCMKCKKAILTSCKSSQVRYFMQPVCAFCAYDLYKGEFIPSNIIIGEFYNMQKYYEITRIEI